MNRNYTVLFLVLLVCCEPKQKTNENTEQETVRATRDSFFLYLKDPVEISRTVVPGMDFHAELLNPTAQFINYAGNDVKAAANMGIYLADLNYCILHKQVEKIEEYFNVTYELSKVLVAEKRTIEFLMKRYEANINRHDSVKLVMQQLLSNSTAGLKDTDRERLAGIAMAAYQVENLHLALQTLASFPEVVNEDQQQTKKLLQQFVLDQQQKIELIYKFVQEHADPLDPDRNPNYPFYDNALRELISTYQDATAQNPQLNELREKVAAIRNKTIAIE